MSDVQNDAPSASEVPPTAIEAAVASGDQAAFEEARRASLVNPVPPIASKPADSTPAKPAEQAVSTDTKDPVAASEPAKKGAEARTKELDADITELREKLRIRAALREELNRPAAPPADAKPAASSPAPAAETFPEFAEYLAQHPEASLESYIDARADFRDAQRSKAAAADADKRTRETQHQELAASFGRKVDAALKEIPDFKAVALDAPTDVIPGSFLDAWILDSDLGARVLYHVQKTPGEARRLMALPITAQAKELSALEATFAKPAPKTITSAPEPPVVLGHKPADPADPITAAVATGDQRAYEQARFAGAKR